ncbi:hypothetical protein I656_03790 [Geobacillus sp. WSUCF1]|nr:hypothetical protein I656_03790 [Geobacillus sp. WSUCF1]
MMDVGLIQAIQMARQSVVIEPRGVKSKTDQLGQVDLMRPSFQVNERLPAVKDCRRWPKRHRSFGFGIEDRPERDGQSTGGGQAS